MCNIPRSQHVGDTTDPLTHDARDLVPDGTTARIVLDGQPYTLRITRSGKLILTK
ncbi:MAG: hemin uptake protein HemP [Loktanella sp.]|nr:hemin uptake protein HemP [Loktanella sp.]